MNHIRPPVALLGLLASLAGALTASARPLEDEAPGGAEKAAKPPKEGTSGRSKKAALKKSAEEFQKLRDKFDAERKLEPYERIETIIAFGEVPSRQTIDFLAKLYEEEAANRPDAPSGERLPPGNLGIINAITQALARIGSVDALKAIMTAGMALISQHPGGLEELQTYLSRPFDNKAEEWLIKNGLSSVVREKPEAVVVMVKAIARLRSKAKLGVLLGELKSAQPGLQITILEALRPLADEKVAAVASHLVRSENVDLRIAASDSLAITGSPKYKSVFIAALKDPHWEMRVLAIDALGQLKDRDFVKQAASLMRDKDERVRVAAVQGLLQVGSPEAVDALIKGMEGAEGRVLDDIADALARLTKKNLGPIQVQWEGWWAQNRDRVKDLTPLTPDELARMKEEEAKNQATAIGPFYFGLRVLTSRAAFAIDCSESMLVEYRPKEAEGKAKEEEKKKGSTSVAEPKDAAKDGGGKGKKKGKKKSYTSRLDIAKQELLSVVKGLKDGARLNILRFNSEISDFAAESVPPENASEKKALVALDPKGREAAEKYIRISRAEGLTNLMGVLRQAFLYDEVDTIFLLSDGAPTVGITDHDELLRELGRLNRRRKIKINVISFNPEPPERKLLKALSDQNYGVYVEK